MRPLLTTLLGLVIAVGAYFVGERLLFPPGSGYTVVAEFEDAGGLVAKSDVKIGRVRAGTVKEIELGEGDRALVTLELNDGAHPIGAGARASSRPVNLLGEKYVDLDPGDLSRPRPSRSRVPASRTTRAVELDELLNTLDPTTRVRMRLLIQEAGTALVGRGADFNALLDALPRTLGDTTRLVDELAADSARLGRLIDAGDRVTAAVHPRGDQLGELIDEASETLQVTASRRRELAATVQSAPASLRQLTSTLGRLRGVADRLLPVGRRVQQAAPRLSATLARLPDLADDAAPAFAAVRSTAPRLTSLARRGMPGVGALRRTGARLQPFADQLAPNVATLESGGLKDALRAMEGWGSATSNRDPLGHKFRGQLVITREFVGSMLDRLARERKPPTTRAERPRSTPRPDRKPAAAPKPEAPAPSATPKRLPDVVNGVTGTLEDVVGGITGRQPQAPEQRRNLLDLLLAP